MMTGSALSPVALVSSQHPIVMAYGTKAKATGKPHLLPPPLVSGPSASQKPDYRT
jgi:hypothetical protein